MSMTLVEHAIADIQQGKMVIITDDKNRENEGDLVMAADKITAEGINFMAHNGCGLICMPMSDDHFKRLDIPMMVQNNQSTFHTAFGVSIGAAQGITTGISAYDRALTVQIAVNPQSTAADIVKPGHVFPLKAVNGGVLKRKGQTEASVDLMKLAGLNSVAVICEIMNRDGTMAREADLKLFSDTHQLTVISVQDILEYRLKADVFITKTESANFPTQYGPMQIHHYQSALDALEWIAITAGDIEKQSAPLVRLHSQCLTGDVFHSKRCDCGEQLDVAMRSIAHEGGVLLYLPQEGRSIGLSNKIKSYALQDKGLDTVEANQQLGFQADAREYFIPAQILKNLAVERVRLMTNNVNKISQLKKYGIDVVERIPLIVEPNHENIFYLKTKQNKLGHELNL
ncbi:MAG: bifunctional 3,4-dihydroxy-2-butanone 4-phosphate synthase/GTP cyclohydrolase II [Gammaproteobacteria bacterium RIFCSPHIGHO2_12_FULL_40_19]|nr:MAG: bifunctional 3,4-dihydroxy-2-butanone 4-phosphate synthase/GTP cyclohydrolase II [Gammaproteobacteria bacterium RIFCSPHIGHO2_12_FULL_40_19]